MIYPKRYFTRSEVIVKAETWGLTSIENGDLTLDGLIAKMYAWDEGNHGVEAFIYDMTKRDIEEAGGVMPEDIRRLVDEPPTTFTVLCPCQTEVEIEDGTTKECPNCGIELDDKGNIL
jgi:hypothetical protein